MSSTGVTAIGVDAHPGSCSICVMTAGGQVLFETVCRSEPGQLAALLKSIADPKDLVIEESTIADMLYRELRPLVRQMIVSNPRENHLIAKKENLNDREAARLLAHLLRMGFVKPVYHTQTELRYEFKRLVCLYQAQVRQTVAIKNRIKATFSSYLIPYDRNEIYSPQHRDEYLGKLPLVQARERVRMIFEDLDHAVAQRDHVKSQVERQARQFPQIASFEKVPGIGIVRAATWYAVIDTPERFVSEAHLWTYCGLGIVRRESGQGGGPEHLTRRGNPMLKNVLKGAAIAAIGKGDSNRFERQYNQLVANHRSEPKARLTVARSIATTMLTMWLTGEDYADNHIPPRLR